MVYVPIIHMMLGKDGPRQKINRANLQRFRELILRPKSQTKRGSFTMVEPGDARAISKPKTKRNENRENKSGSGS